MNKLKNIFIAIMSALSSWLGLLFVPVMILIITNLIDYGTGLCAAKYRNESIKSYKSIRGIAKKICMWLLVGVGAVLDWLLMYAADFAGIDIKLNFVVASVAAVWLIANEIISILENISDIGTPLPPFLMKIAKNIKSQAENKTGDDTDNDVTGENKEES